MKNMLKKYWPTIFRSLRITKIAPGLKSDATTAPATPGGTHPSPSARDTKLPGEKYYNGGAGL